MDIRAGYERFTLCDTREYTVKCLEDPSDNEITQIQLKTTECKVNDDQLEFNELQVEFS